MKERILNRNLTANQQKFIVLNISKMYACVFKECVRQDILLLSSSHLCFTDILLNQQNHTSMGF